MGSVILRPGINTMATPSLNEAGFSDSEMVRYQSQMIQKIGGWQTFYPVAIGSTIKEMWSWQGFNNNSYLGVGATQSLSVINSGSNQVLTPQTVTTNNAPRISISSGSRIVTISDAGSNVTTYDSIYFNTPVAIGNLLLNGAYQVNSVGGSTIYTILSSVAASTTITSSGVLPFFTVSSGSAVIDVVLSNNNYQQIPGLFYNFIAPTTLGGLTIQGAYSVTSIIDSTEFKISATRQSTGSGTGYMNGGNAQIVYYYTGGPTTYTGYGGGPYGGSFGSSDPSPTGYGSGSPTSASSGVPITATDWSLANWGEALLAVPKNGPLYVWAPSGGLTTFQVVPGAPFFNGGMFISQPQQILVMWKSVQPTGVQDNLIVRWSDALSYSNWVETSQTYAGSFTIPTGSVIKGGLQAPTQGVIWTDVDAWTMQYVGQPLVFNFSRVGTGCGLVGQHAAGILNGNVYWMSYNNFFILANSGVQTIPCTVWNYVFQNIDTANLENVRCATNSLFSEVTWYFPAAGGNGQNSLYVKFNVAENEWDYGTLNRTAWVDTSVLGNPIGSDTSGMIYQHEMSYNANGAAINASFQTGYWAIAEGNELSFVDWVIPDMQYGTYGTNGATLSITLYAADYPGDTPRVYGPYPFSDSTQYINTRLRGRLMSMRVESSDLNSFWRLGRIRYRYAPSGRR